MGRRFKKPKPRPTPTVRQERPSNVVVQLIERKIYLVRGEKVMLDSDLAVLYQVPTFRLNEAVKRNGKRFPQDFMFRLTGEEADSLTSQIAMSKAGRGGRRTLPYAFTEHGVAMLSSVLNSGRAVEMNILIVRAFIKLREMVASHKDLARKLEELERTQKQQSRKVDAIYGVVKRLIEAPSKPKHPIGFATGDRPA